MFSDLGPMELRASGLHYLGSQRSILGHEVVGDELGATHEHRDPEEQDGRCPRPGVE